MDIILGAVSEGLLWAVMTMGVFITYKVLDYADLTVEGSITMGAAISARLITGGVNPIVTLFIAMLGGLLAGFSTGILHTKLKIPSLLSGILSMIALYSINIRIMGKANISLLRDDTAFTLLAKLGIPNNIAVITIGLIVNIIIVLVLYWFFSTEIGYSIRATGDNARMSRAQGINTDNMTIVALMISNGFVALAGALIAQNQRFSDMNMGTGSIVIGLASVIIGQVLFTRKSFLSKLISVIMGAVIYRLIIAFVLEMGMNPLDLKLFTALTVVFALTLPNLKSIILSKKEG